MIHQLNSVMAMMIGLFVLGGPVSASSPVPVILDTDMGNDVDDVFALGMLHALQDREECEILAVTVSKDHELAGPFCDMINTFYGHGSIPIGTLKSPRPGADGPYLKAMMQPNEGQALPHRLRNSNDAPSAVTVLRKALASQEDGAVVVIAIGPLTNISDLLNSAPDGISPLRGIELVATKARRFVTMSGHFQKPEAEFNVYVDGTAAANVYAKWPLEMVVCPFEVGESISYPETSLRDDFRFTSLHPLREANFATFGKLNGFRTWDLDTVLQAIRPDRGYFKLSTPGTVRLDEANVTHFDKKTDGKHRYVIAIPENTERIREALANLASQPPERSSRPPIIPRRAEER